MTRDERAVWAAAFGAAMAKDGDVAASVYSAGRAVFALLFPDDARESLLELDHAHVALFDEMRSSTCG